jgi:hypothetical protein
VPITNEPAPTTTTQEAGSRNVRKADSQNYKIQQNPNRSQYCTASKRDSLAYAISIAIKYGIFSVSSPHLSCRIGKLRGAMHKGNGASSLARRKSCTGHAIKRLHTNKNRESSASKRADPTIAEHSNFNYHWKLHRCIHPDAYSPCQVAFAAGFKMLTVKSRSPFL